MDYDYILHKVFAKAEYFIIKQFKEFKADDRPYPHSVDKIRFRLTKIYEENRVNKNIDLFNSCYRIFNFRKDYYGDSTSIIKIVNNEIKKEFGEVIKSNKPVDNNSNVINNYTFNRFVYDLIIYDTLKRIEARLNKNSDLYKLYYETEDYTSFTLRAFDGHVINSKIYQDLYSKVYPNKMAPVAICNINQFGNEEWNIKFENASIAKASDEFKNSPSVTIKPEINSIAFNISKFTEDEKIFLLSVIYNSKNEIPQTEYLKLILITNSIKDYNLFDESPIGNNKTYRKFNGGIDAISTNKKRAFINEVIEKISFFNLKSIQLELNLIKKKIN